MSGQGCLTSDLRRCEASLLKDLVFIIGSGSSEFEKEIEAVKEVLGNFGLKGYFALLSQEEKGFEAFCTKICSKIISSQFCVVMLHEPVEFSYLDKETKGEKIHRSSRPNIYFEFGMATTFKKRIIPLIPDSSSFTSCF